MEPNEDLKINRQQESPNRFEITVILKLYAEFEHLHVNAHPTHAIKCKLDGKGKNYKTKIITVYPVSGEKIPKNK